MIPSNQEQLKSLSEQIASDLIAAILSRRYYPGDRLPSERDLATHYKANRGAVREALRTIEQRGLAKVMPGGARVISVADASLAIVSDLLEHPDYSTIELIDQTLEAFSAMMSVAAKRAIANGSDKQCDQVVEMLEEVKCATGDEIRIKMSLVGDKFFEMGNHLVLKLAINDMKVEVMSYLENLHDEERAADPMLIEALSALQVAIGQRDVEAASKAIEQQFNVHRQLVSQYFIASRQSQQELK